MLTREQLGLLNPWWSDAGWASADLHLVAAESAPFRWDPRPFDDADLGSGALFTLRGPRQSGKTTVLKRLIADRTPRLARRTCYLSLQPLRDSDELLETIQSVLRLWPEETSPWLFLLDEVTFVDGWARALMFLRDTDATFRRSTIIVSGSSAVDVSQSASILAGRRGETDRSLDRVHLPISFREYVGFRDPMRIPGTGLLVTQLPETPANVLEESAIHAVVLDEYLGEYLRSGGLPRAVRDMLTAGVIADGAIEEAWRLVVSDVLRLGRSDATMQKLLARVVVALGSPMSWPDLAGEMGVSGSTAQDYTDLLAASFVLLVLHQGDMKRQGGPSLRRRRKVYVADPLYAWIPSRQGGASPAESALVENVLAVTLFRQTELRAVERFAVPSTLFLWRSSNDREIDFVVGRDRFLAVESKYARAITGKDRESLVKAFGGGIIVSRSTLDVGGPVRVIPAGLLLAMLETRRAQ